MFKKGFVGIFTAVLVLGMASMALAADGSAKGMGMFGIFSGIALGCGLAIGLAALGTGIGMGSAINGALLGTARNPEASGKLMTTMIIGLALIESLCIYALLICLLMVFKIPSLDAVMKAIGG